MLSNQENIKSQINGDSFIDIIVKNNSMDIAGVYVESAIIKFNNVLINSSVFFDKSINIGKSLVIDSCIFENEFIINDIHIEKNIIIKNSVFKSGLIFECIYEAKDVKSVVSVYDSYFYGPLNIMSYRFEKLLQIKNCLVEDFDITRADIFKLVIEENTFINGFSIDYNIIKDSKIQDNKFNKHLGITGSHFNIFKLLDNTILCNVVLKRNVMVEESELSENIIDGNLDLIDNTFEKKVYIHALTVKNKIDLISNVSRSDFDVYKVSSDSLHILSGNFDKGILINETKIFQALFIAGGKIKESLNISSGVINKIFVSVVSSNETIIIEEDVVLSYFEITSVLPKDSFIYFNTNCKYIKFNHFKNFGSMFFTNVNSTLKNENPVVSNLGIPVLSIVNSDLGKIVFINCDLSVYELDFFSSKITDIFVAGTTMPEYIKGNDTRQKKLGYSQIKKVYENRGDKVESNRFFAKEMEAYRSTLSFKVRSERGEKLNLCLNKVSTNYGQDWVQGLKVTFGVSSFLLFLYCFSLGITPPIHRFPTALDLNNFWKVASYYPEFINPLRKADYLSEQLLKIKYGSNESIESFGNEEVTSLSRWIEGFSRVVIAYLIYQLIQAFRKHGKSSS